MGRHLGMPVEQTNSIGMKFALIPPGEFDMGSTPRKSPGIEEGKRNKASRCISTLPAGATAPSEELPSRSTWEHTR